MTGNLIIVAIRFNSDTCGLGKTQGTVNIETTF